VKVGYVSGGCVVILDCILSFPRPQTHERLPHIVMPCSQDIYYVVEVGVSVDVCIGLGVDFF
jgi:hypothetical protein